MCVSCMKNITSLQWDTIRFIVYGEWDTIKCLVYGECHTPSIGRDIIGYSVYGECHAPSSGHERASPLCLSRMSRSLNRTHMSAKCMANITLLEWDTNVCLVYGECTYLQWDKNKWLVHGDCLTFPMGHNRLSAVCGLPRFFNGTQMSASYMENIAHLQWNKT